MTIPADYDCRQLSGWWGRLNFFRAVLSYSHGDPLKIREICAPSDQHRHITDLSGLWAHLTESRQKWLEHWRRNVEEAETLRRANWTPAEVIYHRRIDSRPSLRRLVEARLNAELGNKKQGELIPCPITSADTNGRN